MIFSVEGGWCTLCRLGLSELYCVTDPNVFWYRQYGFFLLVHSGNNRFGFLKFWMHIGVRNNEHEAYFMEFSRNWLREL
jgi:hypothetical protein